MADKLTLLNSPPKRDNRCGTATWLEALDSGTRAAVVSAFGNKAWKSTDLHQLLVSEFDYKLGYNQLVRHRNGVCCA